MADTLRYRGYDGSVQYSAEDKLLHGRILGIRDMVSYDGTSLRSIEKNFRGAVEEYLAFCMAEGKVPNKPFKGSFHIRIFFVGPSALCVPDCRLPRPSA